MPHPHNVTFCPELPYPTRIIINDDRRPSSTLCKLCILPCLVSTSPPPIAIRTGTGATMGAYTIPYLAGSGATVFTLVGLYLLFTGEQQLEKPRSLAAERSRHRTRRTLQPRRIPRGERADDVGHDGYRALCRT